MREHTGRADLPDLRVHRSDDMFRWSLSVCDTEAVGTMAYFRSGTVIADTLRQVAAQWFGAGGPGRVLDFACGYGRVLRYVIHGLGAARVTGAEILPDAVEFVGSTLGATGLASSTDPDDLDVEGRYDLVVVSSLFTHLPEATFVPWLARLHRLVAPGGLLVLSVHGRRHLPEGAAMPEGGLWFQPLSEIDSLATEDYGATVVSEAFMDQAVEQACSGAPHRLFPNAWCFEQDAWVVAADPDADLSELTLRSGVQGHVDSVVAPATDALTVSGWAATHDEGVRVVDVDVRVDDRLLARGVPTLPRPDVQAHLRAPGQGDCLRSGWRVTGAIGPVGPGSVLTVVAHSSDGGHGAIWATRLVDCLDRRASAELWAEPGTGARSARSTVRRSLADVGPVRAARRARRALRRRTPAVERVAHGSS